MDQVMEYNILDFSKWEDDSQFGNTFNKLIDGLELFHKSWAQRRVSFMYDGKHAGDKQ